MSEDILERAKKHLEMLSSHLQTRTSVVLLSRCVDEIDRLRAQNKQLIDDIIYGLRLDSDCVAAGKEIITPSWKPKKIDILEPDEGE